MIGRKMAAQLSSTAIVWFKSTDLRLHDHLPLAFANVRTKTSSLRICPFYNCTNFLDLCQLIFLSLHLTQGLLKDDSVPHRLSGGRKNKPSSPSLGKFAPVGLSSSSPPLSSSASTASGFTNILPVYVFDPRFLGVGRSSFGFQKSGVLRARFLRESVADLRANLRAKGSDLLIRTGAPEDILPEVRIRIIQSLV
jgi:deoxyribodipyrimidine photolyase